MTLHVFRFRLYRSRLNIVSHVLPGATHSLRVKHFWKYVNSSILEFNVSRGFLFFPGGRREPRVFTFWIWIMWRKLLKLWHKGVRSSLIQGILFYLVRSTLARPLEILDPWGILYLLHAEREPWMSQLYVGFEAFTCNIYFLQPLSCVWTSCQQGAAHVILGTTVLLGCHCGKHPPRKKLK